MAAASRPSVEVNSTGSGVVVGVRTVDLFEGVGEGLPARAGAWAGAVVEDGSADALPWAARVL
ncbi:hypothetical protein [Nocardia abscessus]|uniref:hypothetical protein n=1 Tax=Nocardia abscessus TaxID=120957 RepID=UPI002453AB4E|nr:hypothetical protein [Nocardia abscessus]